MAISDQQSIGSQSLLRLGDAARAAGVTVQQLQYYCMVGLIEPSVRSGGDQRLFDRRTIKKVRMVKLLNASGYGLREIREIFLGKKAVIAKPKAKAPKIATLKKSKAPKPSKSVKKSRTKKTM